MVGGLTSIDVSHICYFLNDFASKLAMVGEPRQRSQTLSAVTQRCNREAIDSEKYCIVKLTQIDDVTARRSSATAAGVFRHAGLAFIFVSSK
jgi:hypothetical protein